MLLLVLCRVSLSVVKQKLNFFSPSTYKKCSITVPEYVSACLRSNYYYSNKGKTLTKVITSCFNRTIVVNFFQEIFLAQCEFSTSKTKASRMDYFKVCPPLTIRLVKKLLRSTWEQWSTLR